MVNRRALVKRFYKKPTFCVFHDCDWDFSILLNSFKGSGMSSESRFGALKIETAWKI